MLSTKKSVDNPTTPGIPYFSPRQDPSPGTASTKNGPIPTLFTPLVIRGVTLRNRIMVAPMCQYSCAPDGPEIGALTPYHIATLGHYALKGASLVCVEATGVQPSGRISPNCPGLWSDDQIPALKSVADFIRGQGAVCALQLAHAGRKSSTAAMYASVKAGKKGKDRAAEDIGGWPKDVVGPSGGPDFTWDLKPNSDPTGGFWEPRELTIAEIHQLVLDWQSAARRAVQAGVEVLEIHAAHGYLLGQFLSPVTNRRQDQYGGSFENRTRLLVEIVQAIRAVVPSTMPLFLRVSATEWLEDTDVGRQSPGGTWDVPSSIRLAHIVADLGVDLFDVSSGGNHPAQTMEPFGDKNYQVRIAGEIRRDLRAAGKHMLVSAVGLIVQSQQARQIVQDDHDESSRSTHGVLVAAGTGSASVGEEAQAAVQMTDTQNGAEPQADAVFVARQFMREPEWVLRVAHELGVDVAWPAQFMGIRFPKL